MGQMVVKQYPVAEREMMCSSTSIWILSTASTEIGFWRRGRGKGEVLRGPGVLFARCRMAACRISKLPLVQYKNHVARRNPDDAAVDRAYEEYKQQMEFIAAEFLDRQYDPITNDRMNKKEELLP